MCTSRTGRTLESVLAQVKARGKKWVDPDFIPSPEILFTDPSAPHPGHPDPRAVRWLRPAEFCPGKPEVFIGGATAGDVQQGQLGDCWFLGSISVLATRRKLLQRIFTTTEYGAEYGIYSFCIFKDCMWHSIIIDDLIPCLPKRGTPIYAKSADPNELWVSLLEKAYAKVHECYENLKGGYVHEGLADLTSGVPYQLDTPPDAGTNIELYKKIDQMHAIGCLVGAASDGDNDTKKSTTGIVQGHAYSVLQVEQVEGFHLLKLRNPWGLGEWTGRWSDSSSEWEKYPKVAEKLKDKKADDGTFWMDWKDFCIEYKALYVCRVFPPEWTGARVAGEWTDSNAGGGWWNANTWKSNKQYLVEVPEDGCSVVIVLQQGESKDGKRSYDIGIGFGIAKVAGPDALVTKWKEFDPALNSSFVRSRQVSKEVELNKGYYRFVPMTYGPGQKNKWYALFWSEYDIAVEDEIEIDPEDEVPEEEVEKELEEEASLVAVTKTVTTTTTGATPSAATVVVPKPATIVTHTPVKPIFAHPASAPTAQQPATRKTTVKRMVRTNTSQQPPRALVTHPANRSAAPVAAAPAKPSFVNQMVTQAVHYGEQKAMQAVTKASGGMFSGFKKLFG